MTNVVNRRNRASYSSPSIFVRAVLEFLKKRKEKKEEKKGPCEIVA